MSSVTHELRTPLTSIRALAELMGDDADMPAAQRQRFLGIVVAETERLGRLVNQVLDMAKIESGHAEWHGTRRRPARAAGAGGADHGRDVPRARRQGATAAAGALPPLRADPDRLMQVLLNLLSNAAKFVPGEGGRVEMRLRADEAGVTVEVQDNGPGVPPEQQALMFEKFRQGGDAANRPQGTGLGLPISRQIVEHFGGRMWLRSEPGHGACFAFSLPWSGAAGTASNGPRGREEHVMTSKILIADDEPNIVISLEYLIKREGYDVIVARDGQEALDAIERELPTWCCWT